MYLPLYLILFPFFCSASEFTPHTDIFKKNVDMYALYLTNDYELSELGRLHLLGLRLLIDIKLDDRRGALVDSDEIYEIIINDEYLMEEFKRKYGAN